MQRKACKRSLVAFVCEFRSERGCVQSARKAAVGLLDFHKMVEKYRQVVASRTKSSSSGSGRRGPLS